MCVYVRACACVCVRACVRVCVCPTIGGQAPLFRVLQRRGQQRRLQREGRLSAVEIGELEKVFVLCRPLLLLLLLCWLPLWSCWQLCCFVGAVEFWSAWRYSAVEFWSAGRYSAVEFWSATRYGVELLLVKTLASGGHEPALPIQ